MADSNTNSVPVTSLALFGATLDDLRQVMATFGQPKFRARQLADALYRQRANSLDEITTLSAELRGQMAEAGYVVGLPELAQTAKSVDGTERYLVRLADGETVETVWMPGGDGGERGDGTEAAHEEETEDPATLYKRATICVSSQVGCAVNCQFCLTAKLGIRRNLTPGEIAGQVAAVLNRHRVNIGTGKGQGNPDRINLVFMGMGEPFLNYDSFMAAVKILVNEMGIPSSRMTVSTSGILPGIERYATEPIRPKLALSLNASNDTVRGEIMPITRKWNIGALLDAVKAIPLSKREYVTFEYVLLGGVNDQPQHAAEVLALLKGMQAKVNLIVWNPGPGVPYEQPTPESADRFHKLLIAGGVPAFTRRPRGRDIYAACGQLKRTVEAEPAPQLVTIASMA
ncbi:23S rRNA m(2)A-2503 methyltransferase [Granulicella rosea]|uniref:Probable dual-specificity RNA methyltransferase RlmN n=1 Tax=Granulicella rosea TaxID=474952 RepID=A0A239EWV9_9BACT|nr:23S rRNA (adenine(2503)-C(2))-methyltransferase RlmN [Granulicella rosea]SNS48788.1 23S rRNA m(2)A-2503 methyltransferase [Granulicella rosea]